MLFSDLEMEKLLCGTFRFASSKMLSIITILGNKFKFLLHSSSTKNLFFFPAAGGETVIKEKTEIRKVRGNHRESPTQKTLLRNQPSGVE